jgi:antirestriction protein
MQIYVGTYKKYNEGNLDGEWVDLSIYDNKDDFYEYCAEIHEDEEDPEFMFQDTEGDLKYFVSESSIDDNLWEFLEESSDPEEEFQAFAAYASYLGGECATYSDFQEAYQGEFDSEEDFAEHILEECGDLNSIPKHLRYYFDYEEYARDLFIDDFYFTDGFVFRRM